MLGQQWLSPSFNVNFGVWYKLIISVECSQIHGLFPLKMEGPFKGHRSLEAILGYRLYSIQAVNYYIYALQTVHSCYKISSKGNMELHITDSIKKKNQIKLSGSTRAFPISLPPCFWLFFPLFHTPPI